MRLRQRLLSINLDMIRRLAPITPAPRNVRTGLNRFSLFYAIARKISNFVYGTVENINNITPEPARNIMYMQRKCIKCQ